MPTVLKKLKQDQLFIGTTVAVILLSLFGRINFSAISWSTVLSLLSLLTMVTLYQSLGLIDALADYFLKKAKTTRSLSVILFLLAFFSAMVVTNDVAILTLLPLTFALAKKSALPLIKTASLTAIYANLGSAASPIGNPQNIYLLAHYGIPFTHLFETAALLLILGLATMPLFALTIPKTSIGSLVETAPVKKFNRFDVILLITFTAVAFLSLITQKNLSVTLVMTFMVSSYFDQSVIEKVDYVVVISIANFFLLVSALMTWPFIYQSLSAIGSSQAGIFAFGAVVSQIISNVPAAALLAPFTEHVQALYLALSVGGFGTLVASLANLLAYRQIKANHPQKTTKKFFKTFTWHNVLFLILGFALSYLDILF